MKVTFSMQLWDLCMFYLITYSKQKSCASPCMSFLTVEVTVLTINCGVGDWTQNCSQCVIVVDKKWIPFTVSVITMSVSSRQRWVEQWHTFEGGWRVWGRGDVIPYLAFAPLPPGWNLTLNQQRSHWHFLLFLLLFCPPHTFIPTFEKMTKMRGCSCL